eukprot:3989252-Amphidinium_carterae.1
MRCVPESGETARPENPRAIKSTSRMSQNKVHQLSTWTRRHFCQLMIGCDEKANKFVALRQIGGPPPFPAVVRGSLLRCHPPRKAYTHQKGI